MNLNLKAQWALITGSARGIGWGIAEGFLREDARVILLDCDEQALYETLRAFEKQYGQGRALGICGDVLQDQAKLATEVQKKTSHLDHLICNVGSGRSVPLLEEDVKEFQRMLDINLLGAVNTATALLPILEKNPREEAAKSITFIGSICGVEAIGCPVAYASAKSALITYAKNIARPLGSKGIRVNVVSPGNILFPGSVWDKKIAQDSQAVESMLQREVPMRRLGSSEEVANVVVFLSSVRASFVSGANWIVDGGQTRSF